MNFKYLTYVFVVFISLFFPVNINFFLQPEIKDEKTDICFMIKLTCFAISTRINNYFSVNKREKRQVFKLAWKTSTRSSYRRGQVESFCLKESPFGTIFQCQNKTTNLLALIKKQACLKDIIMNFMKNMVKVNYFFCFLVSKFCRFVLFFFCLVCFWWQI